MKHHHFTRALALISLLAAAPAALAQTPSLVPYQGRVQIGTPAADFTGTGQFKFALIDQSPIPFVQATATVIRAAGVQSLAGATFTVANGGTGYTTAPAVTVSAPQVGGGVTATVTATVSGGVVTGFVVATPGSGYTANPTLTIAAPPAPTPTIVWNNNGPAPAAPVNAIGLTVTNGLYSVLLGDTSLGSNMAAIPSSVFSRPDLRLRVWFNGTQLIPDQRLAPNGYVSTLPGLSIATSTTDSTATASLDILANGGHKWRLRSISGFGAQPAGTTGAFELYDVTTGIKAITALANGNVGIGSSNPAETLTVQTNTGDATATAKLGLFANGGHKWVMESVSGSGGGFGSGAAGSFQIHDATTSTHGLTITETGNVGIGTTTPTQAKLVVSGGINNNPHPGPWGFLNQAGANIGTSGARDISIYTTQSIWTATSVLASSDERIKIITGLSSSATDLQTLLGIQVTDYRFKDTFGKGNASQKKLIAQQVEKCYPQAVSKQTDVVPDIYKRASLKDGWIEMKTDLKKGERVRLTDDKTTDVFEVLEVAEGKFRTAFKPEGDKVFVYGREVKDFRTVDYDAIAMLNVSATQELARQLDVEKAAVFALQKANATLDAENTALKAALAENASKDKAQDEQLAALAKLLEDRAPSAAVTTVSTRR